MLRITIVESSGKAVILRVEGRITGSYVEELRRACDAHAAAEEVQLSLELADVLFVDAAGVALLRELQTHGVTLLCITPFMAERLKGGASSDTI